jgi:hypothetical protein
MATRTANSAVFGGGTFALIKGARRPQRLTTLDRTEV